MHFLLTRLLTYRARLMAFAVFSAVSAAGVCADITLLNTSYDPTREFYREYNAAFVRYWQAKTGEKIEVRTSHGASGVQMRHLIEGAAADVVTLGAASYIDDIAEKGKLLSPQWQKLLPNNSAPYTSTIVFLVRKGNPKGIKDWDDLAKAGVSVVMSNPKTSAGGSWAYLAAWGYALQKFTNDEAKAREFVARLLQNVPAMETGARGATTTFAERGTGDVLLTWESEAFLAVKQVVPEKFEVVAPSVSILVEPAVAILDKVVEKRNTRTQAQAYLEYLYGEEGQDIAGKHYFRPRSHKAVATYARQFPPVATFTIEGIFGGWAKAQKTHFADGGSFDQIYKPK